MAEQAETRGRLNPADLVVQTGHGRMSGVPIGKREGQRLEFKGEASARKRDDIARSVVAMLNAEGGEVWIGIRTEGEVAIEAEPFGADACRRSLEDFFTDSVRPAPQPTELRLETVDVAGGMILRITCCPNEERKPYAHQRKGGFVFACRYGARIRPLTWEEISWFFGRDSDDGEEALSDVIEATWLEWKELHEGGLAPFWLAAVPAHPLAVDLSDPILRRLLADPTSSGNSGSYYSALSLLGRDYSPRLYDGDLCIGDPHESQQLSIMPDGRTVYRCGRERLQLPAANQGNQLHSFTLLGVITSFHRFACAVYRQVGLREGDQVATLTELFSPDGFTLPAGSSRRMVGLPRVEPGRLREGRPTRIETRWQPWPQPLKNPDTCAYAVVKSVYERFGLFEEAIPPEFDRTSRRLSLPE